MNDSRISLVSINPSRAYLTALALAGAVAACSATVDPETMSAPRAADDSAGGSDSPTYIASDASAASERSLLANPLCGFTDESCFPDDDGILPLTASSAERCAEADAGPLDDASVKTSACRVRKGAGSDNEEKDNVATYVPQCTTADRTGIDGATCSGSADCAPGFDCVAGEKGAVCRRYCCTGSCELQPSANAGPTFCDIQKPVDLSEHKVPVCMPLKSCKLFAAGECGQDETCAIVTETGATGCIAKGSAKVGEPCDADHCEGGLTCLGSPGDRRCYKLCRIEGADCAEKESCAPSSIFHDMAFGVCNAY